MGISTESAAHRPFNVKSDSDGGQSRMMKSYSGATSWIADFICDRASASASFKRVSRSGRSTSSISAPASSRLAGTTSKPPEGEAARTSAIRRSPSSTW